MRGSHRGFAWAGALLACAFALSTPLGAQDKDAGKIWRIGVLEAQSPSANAANLDEFKKGLRELGYVEGKNLLIEYRSADGERERYPKLAVDLIGHKVDLLLTRATPATLAARNATGTVPVVTAGVVDPVETGVVSSLERPGGKVTGLAIVVKEVEAKRIELLKALAPGTKRLAALWDKGNPALAVAYQATEAAAQSLGMEIALYDVHKPQDIRRAVESARQRGADALIVRLGALSLENRRSLVELAGERRLPAVYASRQFVEAGGLISYGVNERDLYYRAAGFVDKIFKGAKPGDLPMAQPTKFELVINRKAAHALGLVIPPDILLRSEDASK